MSRPVLPAVVFAVALGVPAMAQDEISDLALESACIALDVETALINDHLGVPEIEQEFGDDLIDARESVGLYCGAADPDAVPGVAVHQVNMMLSRLREIRAEIEDQLSPPAGE